MTEPRDFSSRPGPRPERYERSERPFRSGPRPRGEGFASRPPARPLPPKWERAADLPPQSADWPAPWVQLKYFSNHPHFFPAMIGAASPDAKPGDLVAVFDKAGQRFGSGLWNPKARVPLRMVHYGTEPANEALLDELLDRALDLRLNLLDLNAVSDAYRVVSSDGDLLSGLTIDRYADTLSIEVHSLGIFRRLPQWLPRLHERLGTKHHLIEVDDFIARIEGIQKPAEAPVRPVKIREHGVRYEVNFDSGHKTGFFCDQRENRRRLAKFVKGKRVLDLCCYTGGFALAAKVLGGADEVTGVDLDEKVIAQAKRNANLNQVRLEWVHCDAFSFARQMQRNNQRWPVVVLDPPKFIPSKEEEIEGLRKYEDLNGMGMNVLERGGLLVSCSCSGLIDMEGFEQTMIRASYRLGKRVQILDRTGAGGDHPVMGHCPESRYLKVIWARVW